MFFTAVALILEIAGIGTIAYGVWKKSSSGHEVAVAQLQANGGPIRAAEFQFDPSMNPLELTVTMMRDARLSSGSSVPFKKDFHYDARLSLGRKPVTAYRVTFTIDPPPTTKTGSVKHTFERYTDTNWGGFNVPEAGRYRFTLDPTGDASDRLSHQIEVSARANVKGFNRTVLGWGAGLIVLGAVLQLLLGAPLPGSHER
jgi:hypothetical protein